MSDAIQTHGFYTSLVYLFVLSLSIIKLKEFGMQSEPTESEFAKANIVNLSS
jgi:hypothetical protein